MAMVPVSFSVHCNRTFYIERFGRFETTDVTRISISILVS